MIFLAQLKQCPTNAKIKAESGQIVSPKYPNDYGNSMTCSWIIEVPSDKVVAIKFHDIDVSLNEIFNYMFK